MAVRAAPTLSLPLGCSVGSALDAVVTGGLRVNRAVKVLYGLGRAETFPAAEQPAARGRKGRASGWHEGSDAPPPRVPSGRERQGRHRSLGPRGPLPARAAEMQGAHR